MVNKPVPEGEEFRLASGKQVSTVEELLDYLEDSSDEEYAEHVTEDRNDFAAWLRHVHDRDDLASELESSQDKKQAIKILRKAVDEYYEQLTMDTEEEVKFEEPDEEQIEEIKEQEETKKESVPEPETKEPVQEPQERKGGVESTSHGEFIVKEFIYGMIFGFIIGFIAAGLLNSVIG